MISVIVPFKNSANWIGRCAESLHTQDGDFEFIFINDNSSDGGEKIVKEYVTTDNRFRLLDNSHRNGVGGARNTGLDNTTGELVTFLDADDTMLPHAFEKFTLLMLEDPKSSIYQANHKRCYARTGRTVLKYTNPKRRYSIDGVLTVKCWQMVWNKLIKRAFVGDLRFDEEMLYGEDQLFVLECIKKAGFIYCGDVATVVHHFDNKESLSRIKKETDLWLHISKLEDFIKRTEDPRMRCMVCGLLSELWGSGTFKKGIGRQDMEGW